MSRRTKFEQSSSTTERRTRWFQSILSVQDSLHRAVLSRAVGPCEPASTCCRPSFREPIPYLVGVVGEEGSGRGSDLGGRLRLAGAAFGRVGIVGARGSVSWQRWTRSRRRTPFVTRVSRRMASPSQPLPGYHLGCHDSRARGRELAPPPGPSWRAKPVCGRLGDGRHPRAWSRGRRRPCGRLKGRWRRVKLVELGSHAAVGHPRCRVRGLRRTLSEPAALE
jgi:hypothetical protein